MTSQTAKPSAVATSIDPVEARSLSGSRPSRRNSQSRTAGIVRGWSRTSSGGRSSSVHQYCPSPPSENHGNNAAPVTRPVAVSSAIIKAFAVSMVRRGACQRWPNSIWATTGQTEPGRYLPSWLTKNTRVASGRGAATPSPRSRTNQTAQISTVPANASRPDTMTALTPRSDTTARSSAALLAISQVLESEHDETNGDGQDLGAAPASPGRFVVGRFGQCRCPTSARTL